MRVKKKQLIWLGIIIVLAALVGWYWYGKTHQPPKPLPTVSVTKGTVVDQVQAIGYIQPKHSSTIKSAVDGVVEYIYHDAGDYVTKGTPLLRVKPEPEPAIYATAYETLQAAIASENAAKTSYQRYLTALKLKLITPNYTAYISAKEAYETSKEQRLLASQKLALLEKGSTKVGTKTIGNIVRSPIAGFLLTRNVDVGDPVISISSAQSSTALFTMANMHDLMFQGSVDEVDVAKISLKMPATITIAAMPSKAITGELTKIGLQSETAAETASENLPFNVSFQVQITNLKTPKDLTLRSGFSATANIIVKTAKNVLVLPERVLHFHGDKVYVLLAANKVGAEPIKQFVTLGLADGMQAEIKTGVTLGQKVVDQPATPAE